MPNLKYNDIMNRIYLTLLISLSLLLMSCQSLIEPIINDAAEKAVKEYGSTNPLAERIIEVEKVVEVCLLYTSDAADE